jgi:hypothetical protein
MSSHRRSPDLSGVFSPLDRRAIGRELARRMGGDLVLDAAEAGARPGLWLPVAPAA